MPPGEDARPARVVPDRPTKRQQERRSRRRARPRAREDREDYATAARPPFGNWLRDDIRLYANARPPSLDTIWWQHGQAARWSGAGVFRWPRYLWGGVHTGISALGYAVAWITQTVPGALAVAGVIALLIWWPF